MKIKYALITESYGDYPLRSVIEFDSEKMADYFLEKKKKFYENAGYEVIQLMDGIYSIPAIRTTIKVEPIDEMGQILPRYINILPNFQ